MRTNGRLLALGLADEPDDAGVGALGGGPRRPQLEGLAGVGGAAADRPAAPDGGGQRLAGERRLVDHGLRARDDPVHRDDLARADDHAVADGELLHRHLLHRVADAPVRDPRRPRDERAQLLAARGRRRSPRARSRRRASGRPRRRPGTRRARAPPPWPPARSRRPPRRRAGACAPPTRRAGRGRRRSPPPRRRRRGPAGRPGGGARRRRSPRGLPRRAAGCSRGWPEDEHRARRPVRDALAHAPERADAVEPAAADDGQVGARRGLDEHVDGIARPRRARRWRSRSRRRGRSPSRLARQPARRRLRSAGRGRRRGRPRPPTRTSRRRRRGSTAGSLPLRRKRARRGPSTAQRAEAWSRRFRGAIPTEREIPCVPTATSVASRRSASSTMTWSARPSTTRKSASGISALAASRAACASASS